MTRSRKPTGRSELLMHGVNEHGLMCFLSRALRLHPDKCVVTTVHL